ncbi:hypothetical protein [Haloactinomyces albus]|uniref:Uncharacterized protein n=1 Tax=Haloactinomyces albus TaxID=1352928 RepID=A0AAE4CPS3_9ACTN|nr:hypothetical protein [Haloactinomyces albus]MDR7303387.1 hypothetical protein [Haloactinomyces albus]
MAAWRARVMRSYPSNLRNSPREVRLTLLAALDFWCKNTAYRPIMHALELLQRYRDHAARGGLDGIALLGASTIHSPALAQQPAVITAASIRNVPIYRRIRIIMRSRHIDCSGNWTP